MTLEELTEELGRLKEPSFRAGQISQWLHEKMAPDFESMTNLSRDLRRKLEENYQLITLKQADVRISAIDGTRKYLYELPDGNIIESVWMQYKQQRLHLQPGRLPDGLPFLCVHSGRPGTRTHGIGDA